MLLGTQDRDFFPRGIEDRLRYVRDFGFDCFEIDGKLLTEQTKQVEHAVQASGIPVTTACGGYRGWIGDFIEERRLNGVEDLKTILRCIRDVGGTGVVVPAAWGMFTYRLPPMVSPRSREGDRKALLASLDALEPVAEEQGVYVYLEPLNRYQDHMLNTAADAIALIEAGGYSRVRLTFDFYHMNIEEDNMCRTIRRYAGRIGHVHIAENHRYQPGTGSIDFGALIGTLRQIGYRGPLINEGRIRGDDPEKAYRDSIAYVRQFL